MENKELKGGNTRNKHTKLALGAQRNEVEGFKAEEGIDIWSEIDFACMGLYEVEILQKDSAV